MEHKTGVCRTNMKNVLKIFRRDLKRLLRNRAAVLVLGGVCLLPSLYAWFNIAANMDPYGNTQGIKVAVANCDEGADTAQMSLNAGASIMDNLKENKKLGWTFVDEEEAIEGVKSGAYYAAIVIPEDFSDSLLSILSGDVKKPQLDYYINEKKNAIAPKITDTGATTLQQQINDTFSSVASEAISEMVSTSAGNLTVDVDNTNSELLSSISAVRENLVGYQNVLDHFRETVGSSDVLIRDTLFSLEKLKKSDMIDTLLSNNVKLLTAPPLSEWGGQALNKTQLKEIQIEDLLQREPIEVDIHKIASHLEGKRVMITGAAGSIGSEIMRQVASFNPYKLILIDQAETPLHDIRLELQDRWRDIDAETIVADISNATRMEAIFREYKPQYIFHAAAYKHVPMMEDNVSESIQINVSGTRTLADLAVKFGSEKFVMISTDKAVNPTNVMGCSKRICEIYVQSLAKKLQKEGTRSVQFITTRFGNVLGSNGSVIPRFRDQIQRGGPVTVTHPEIIRYFMTIPEACRLVLEAGSMGNGGEIYIFDMGKPVKIVDLAKRMISLSGRTDVKIEFTGLRHGEKLYEELLNVKELTKPTYHEKIMIATVREYDYDEVKERIQKLIDVSYTYDQMKIVAAMKDIVPEFVSKNSCFEALDKKD